MSKAYSNQERDLKDQKSLVGLTQSFLFFYLRIESY